MDRPQRKRRSGKAITLFCKEEEHQEGEAAAVAAAAAAAAAAPKKRRKEEFYVTPVKRDVGALALCHIHMFC